MASSVTGAANICVTGTRNRPMSGTRRLQMSRAPSTRVPAGTISMVRSPGFRRSCCILRLDFQHEPGLSSLAPRRATRDCRMDGTGHSKALRGLNQDRREPSREGVPGGLGQSFGFPLPPLKFCTAGFPQYGFKWTVNGDLRRRPKA